MRTRLLEIFLIVGLGLGLAAQAVEAPKFQSLDQYTRIQIPASAGSSFRLLNGSGAEAVVVVDRVKPGMLAHASSWSDGRVKSVKVDTLGLDKVELHVAFRQDGTESFAYLQGDTLVVDLWKQSPGETAKAEPDKSNKKAPSVKRIAAKKKTGRKLASVVGKKTTEKPSEPVPQLDRDRDLFQRFVLSMPELSLKGGKGGIDLPPAAKMEDLWSFSKGDKSFEFAKQLYREKKYGLAVKTTEIIRRDEPNSPNLPELALLDALSYRKLGEDSEMPALLEKSDRMLEELGARRDAHGEPFPFHSAIRLYFAEKKFNQKDWLPAISDLEYVNETLEKNDPKLPYVQIMLAEAYVKVNQPRRAERLYRYIFQHYTKHPLAKEARYRVADMLALEKNYGRVTEEGRAALAAYPEYEKTRSEVLFQIGEAEFWLGNLKQAEKYFQRFATISSAQTNSALAWVRIGEIREIGKNDVRGAREAYLKAKNGYPFSPGDLAATVRLARIDLHTEKEPGYVVKSLSEMLKDETIDPELKQMAKLTLGDYLLLTGEVGEAVNLAREGMAQTTGKAYEGFKVGYMKALFAKLAALNKAGKFAEGLSLYNQEKKWFDLHGAESFRALADTYRGLGLYATSNELMEKYAHQARRGRGLASRDREAALELAQAKNSFVRGAYADALAHLPGEDENAECLMMRAVSDFRLGKKRDAYSVAEKAVAAAASETLPDEALADLADILIDRDMNNRDFAKMERDVAAVQKRMQKKNERLEYALADALWYQKRHKDAVAAYQSAIEAFPKAANGRAERAKYNMGMSYISLGKNEEAVKQLTQLKDSGQSVWAESAKQELQLMDWEKKYSSVLRTLPPSGLGITE